MDTEATLEERWNSNTIRAGPGLIFCIASPGGCQTTRLNRRFATRTAARNGASALSKSPRAGRPGESGERVRQAPGLAEISRVEALRELLAELAQRATSLVLSSLLLP